APRLRRQHRERGPAELARRDRALPPAHARDRGGTRDRGGLVARRRLRAARDRGADRAPLRDRGVHLVPRVRGRGPAPCVARDVLTSEKEATTDERSLLTRR